jgi:hypothetical protein
VNILYAKPGDWAAASCFLFIKDYFTTAHAPSITVSEQPLLLLLLLVASMRVLPVFHECRVTSCHA